MGRGERQGYFECRGGGLGEERRNGEYQSSLL